MSTHDRWEYMFIVQLFLETEMEQGSLLFLKKRVPAVWSSDGKKDLSHNIDHDHLHDH